MTTTRDIKDKRHLKLHQFLAAPLACHYLTALGWEGVGFDTETGGAIDIDLAMKAPDESLVELQAKAPGEPADHMKGEHDSTHDPRIITSLSSAVEQLPTPARSVAMVAVYAQRTQSLTANPRCLLRHLYGRGVPHEGVLLLAPEVFGEFMLGNWNHVAGVVLLDFRRTADFEFNHYALYPCTVLLNPKADRPANPEWFPRARVLVLDGEVFRWIRGEPRVPLHGLPSGARVVSRLPDT